MTDKKIIAVFGATGSQGGGLAKAILNNGSSEFAVRALTRNTDSDKAKELAALGAEVVSVDLDDASSVEKALEGAYGTYAVTFFWEHFSPEKERTHAKNIALAAKNNGLKHVVWSTLEDTRKWVPLSDDRMPTLMEEYKVPHFDAKGESNKFFEELNVPTTFLLTSFYWDNLYMFGMAPQKDENGNFNLAIPMGDKKLPGIAAEDIGKSAFGILKNPEKYINKTVGIAGEHLTGAQMAAIISKVYDLQINYFPVPFNMYRGFDFPGAEDLGNMFQFKHDFEDYFTSKRSIEETKSLNSELQSFEDFLIKNKDKIQIG